MLHTSCGSPNYAAPEASLLPMICHAHAHCVSLASAAAPVSSHPLPSYAPSVSSSHHRVSLSLSLFLSPPPHSLPHSSSMGARTKVPKWTSGRVE